MPSLAPEKIHAIEQVLARRKRARKRYVGAGSSDQARLHRQAQAVMRRG